MWREPLKKGRKFTAEEVRAIRRQYAGGMSARKLAIANSVNTETIYRMVNRDTYGWVEGEASRQKPAEVIKEMTDAEVLAGLQLELGSNGLTYPIGKVP